MSETHPAETASASPRREDPHAVQFVQLVMQQANMAMLYLGKVAHPDTGQTVKNLDAAKMFIDQIEMLEVKTRGNLDKDEAAFLKQSLMNLHMAFVEAVEAPETKSESASSGPAPAAEPAEGTPAAAAEEEHRKKFSKKY
jgi:hypothetical protein